MTPADARREWARVYLTRCGSPIPEYGSDEWAALPDAAPEKVAAVVAAAEREVLGRQLEDMQLQAELDYAALRFKVADDAAFRAAGPAHRQAFDGKAGRFLTDPRIAAEVEADWRAWAQGDVA